MPQNTQKLRVRTFSGRVSTVTINGLKWRIRIGRHGVRLWCPILPENRSYPLDLIRLKTGAAEHIPLNVICDFIYENYTEIVNGLPIY